MSQIIGLNLIFVNAFNSWHNWNILFSPLPRIYIFLGWKFFISCFVISLPIEPPAPVIKIVLLLIKFATSGINKSTGSLPSKSSKLTFLICSTVTWPLASWSTPGIVWVSSLVAWQSSMISLSLFEASEGIAIIICSILYFWTILDRSLILPTTLILFVSFVFCFLWASSSAQIIFMSNSGCSNTFRVSSWAACPAPIKRVLFSDLINFPF